MREMARVLLAAANHSQGSRWNVLKPATQEIGRRERHPLFLNGEREEAGELFIMDLFEFNLEQGGPVFAGDEQSIGFFVPGDAVEDGFAIVPDFARP